MKTLLVLALLTVGCATRHAQPVTIQGHVSGPKHATYDGHVWYCPAGTYMWVDEVAARNEERNFVYCLTMREMEE